MQPPNIETARLTLRAFREEDVDPLFAIQGNREAMRYTHAASSRQDCAHWLQTFAALESTLGFAPWKEPANGLASGGFLDDEESTHGNGEAEIGRS